MSWRLSTLIMELTSEEWTTKSRECTIELSIKNINGISMPGGWTGSLISLVKYFDDVTIPRRKTLFEQTARYENPTQSLATLLPMLSYYHNWHNTRKQFINQLWWSTLLSTNNKIMIEYCSDSEYNQSFWWLLHS